MPSSSLAASDFRLLDAFWREPVSRSVLPNGVTLIVKPDRSAALASVQVWVKTGSLHEGERLGAGLSHYLEHMLFKGTSRRAGREISATVQAHGGNINAYTTFDRTVYYIDLPSEHTGVAIDLLADAVLHSTLPPDEAAKEKDVILREIAMTKDDPDDRLWEALFSTAFREHPYRHPIIGHKDVFSVMTAEDLRAYYKTRYVPNNLVVVVVGDVDPLTVRKEVDQHFGSVPRSVLAPVLVPAEPGQLAPRAEHRFEDVELSRAAIAWQIPGLTHPDAPILDLLSMVLGHGDSSILWQELREKSGLVHSIGASSWNPGSSGLFCVSYTCDGPKRVPAAEALRKVLGNCLKRGFTLVQLKKALRQLVSGEIRTRQTMSGQASRLGAAEVVVGDLGFSKSYFERLRTVTPAELKRVLKTYLIDTGCTSVSINPEKEAAASAQSGQEGVSSHADFTQKRLPNGARLLLQRDSHLPNVHLRLLVDGGALYEAPAKRGITALMATLLAKDTLKRSAAAVAQRIEEVGGSFHSFSGNNSFGLAAEVLPLDADRALAVLAEATLEPAFKQAAFELEKESQLAGLREDSDDVVTESRKLVRKRFFGSHPLGIDAQGEEETVKALTRADVVALHKKLMVGPCVVLAVAGDFDPKKLGPKLEAFLSKLPKAKVKPIRTAPEPWTAAGAGDFSETRKREQAVVLQAYPGPALHTPDFYVAEVADELFSGMASRLFERVREDKGLAYFVRSTRVTGWDAAMFCFLAGTQPGKEAEVLREIEAEIARVASGGVEPAELTRCQTRLQAARRQSLQSNGARAFQAGLNALQDQPLNDWKLYDGRIAAVTREDLAAFAQRYLVRESRTQLVVRP